MWAAPSLELLRWWNEHEKDKIHAGFKFLVIVPTREAAFQVRDVLNRLLQKEDKQYTCVATVGGFPFRYEQELLDDPWKYPEAVVATPGRLIEHLKVSFFFQKN